MINLESVAAARPAVTGREGDNHPFGIEIGLGKVKRQRWLKGSSQSIVRKCNTK
jgi:hypothetical protein